MHRSTDRRLLTACLPSRACAVLAAATAAPLRRRPGRRQMQRGVNIVGYDPLWRDATQGRFKPRHFELIKASAASARCASCCRRIRFVKTEKHALPDELVRDPRWPGARTRWRRDLTVILDDHDYWICARRRGRMPHARARLLDAGRRALQGCTRQGGVRNPQRAQRRDGRDVERVARRGAGSDPQDQPHAQRGHRPGVLEQRRLAGQARAARRRPAHHRHGALLPADEFHAPGRALDAGVREQDRRHLGHAGGLRGHRQGFRRRAGVGEAATTGPSC